MGCVYSRVEKEETVRRCKERKSLMRQLVRCRSEMAAAHLAYLQSLRNTGATLRQFTEDDSVIPIAGLKRPPLRLPPSPPPPPFSPDSRKDEEEDDKKERDGRKKGDEEKPTPSPEGEEDAVEIDDDGEICKPPPPPLIGSSWDYWDPFDTRSPPSSSWVRKKDDVSITLPEAVEEENWAETNTDFDEEEVAGIEKEGICDGAVLVLKPVKGKSPGRLDFPVDDNSSSVSWFTKDSDRAMVVWRSKQTMSSIVKELDDYFLKASAGGSEVVALLESNRSSYIHHDFSTKGKSSKSAKVFNSLSWRWSSRSPLSSKDALELQAAETCRSVRHCVTLDKLFADEQKLYNEVKEEEAAKLKHKKKIILLHKQEAREEDLMRTEKTRAGIEALQSQISSMQDSINTTCLSISKLRDGELHLQLNDLSSGLMQMWRTMYECHQIQSHISQQAVQLLNTPSIEPTGESHRLATSQLEAELTSWYNTFHKLLKSQREYAHILNQWVRLTDCLPDNNGLFGDNSEVFTLCEEWQLALDQLPEMVASEAIKSFMSVIHSIGLQLNEEKKLQKKSARLQKRLEKELNKHNELVETYDMTSAYATVSTSNSKHMSPKHTKLNILKKKADDEKAKFLSAVGVSRSMMLNNLQTSLPNVFQAMTGFAGMCMQAFENIHRHSKTAQSPHASWPSPF